MRLYLVLTLVVRTFTSLPIRFGIAATAATTRRRDHATYDYP